MSTSREIMRKLRSKIWEKYPHLGFGEMNNVFERALKSRTVQRQITDYVAAQVGDSHMISREENLTSLYATIRKST